MKGIKIFLLIFIQWGLGYIFEIKIYGKIYPFDDLKDDPFSVVNNIKYDNLSNNK